MIRSARGTALVVSRTVVLRLEDVVQQWTARLLVRRGRTVRVRPFPGFGADGWVRVGGRVLVERAPAPGRAAVPVSSTWQALRANLAPFRTVEVPRARVRVEVGGRTAVVIADREGYANALLQDVPLEPGDHTVTFTPVEPPGEPTHGVVHVPHPASTLAVVSDIDDTIIDSGISRGILATLTTALLRDAGTRVPLPGAPELYRALAAGASDGAAPPFFYLSTSPWNLLDVLQGFLHRHGFPVGPLLLTDWGPGHASLLRVGTQQHKLTALRLLAGALPRARFVLVGDSGQQDAPVYAAFAAEHPGRTAAVYIRRADARNPAAEQRLDLAARSLADAGVPFVASDDSAAMLRHAREHGLARS
ncbi:MAG: hypothetical protein JWN08_907 [Frankiales bacterium]|nr:hypothetical protein [Frankiales bacterium]